MAAAVDMSKSGLGNDFGCKLFGYSAFSLSLYTLSISGYFGPAKILPRHQRGGPMAGGYWIGVAGGSYYTCLAAAFCRLAADGGVFRTAVSGRKRTTKPPKMLAAVNSAISRWPSNLFCNEYRRESIIIYWPT